MIILTVLLLTLDGIVGKFKGPGLRPPRAFFLLLGFGEDNTYLRRVIFKVLVKLPDFTV
jgi:hypothetical protein